MNLKYNIAELIDLIKTVPTGKFVAINTYFNKDKKSQINHPSILEGVKSNQRKFSFLMKLTHTS